MTFTPEKIINSDTFAAHHLIAEVVLLLLKNISQHRMKRPMKPAFQ
jgi:hypothetical protein